MTEVVLVSCTKSKQDGTHAARDLYEPSRLFRKRREFALKRADHWGILSGKHGYLRPWEAVEYYEMHRNERSDAWGAIVLDDLLADLEFWDADQVTILAGQDYVDPLVPELESRGIEVLDYNRGLQSGERYSKLKEELAPGEQQKLVTDGGTDSPEPERREEFFSRLGATHDVAEELAQEFDSVAEFLDATFEEKLRAVVGSRQAGKIATQYRDFEQMRDIGGYRAFLPLEGVGNKSASRVDRAYIRRTIFTPRDVLAADDLARKMGFATDRPERTQQTLSLATDGGEDRCAVDTGTPHSEGSR